MNTGQVKYTWVDSLSAFWPGLQVLLGDIELAQKTYQNYLQVWLTYGALPERYDISRNLPLYGFVNYPLRLFFSILCLLVLGQNL